MTPHDSHRRARLHRARTSPQCLPMRTTELGKLVNAAAAGEEWAWTALVVRFRPTVMAVARRHRLCAADCDEVAQRTWLRLLRNISEITTPAQLGAWVTTTARNESLRLLSGAARRELLVDAHADQAADVDLDAGLVADERRGALLRALDQVPARERALVRLLMVDPTPSYEDISAALGIPIGSIGPTRGRCIARLRRDPELARKVGRRSSACPHERIEQTGKEG